MSTINNVFDRVDELPVKSDSDAASSESESSTGDETDVDESAAAETDTAAQEPPAPRRGWRGWRGRMVVAVAVVGVQPRSRRSATWDGVCIRSPPSTPHSRPLSPRPPTTQSR